MKVVFSAVAALLCLNACSLKEAPESHYMVLEAGINDSRTVLDDITKVLWQDTDEICVNGQKSTSVTLSEDCSLAQFTLPLLDPPFEAIYPASAWVEGKAVLPEQQRYVPQSFDPRAALMLSYSASGNSMFFSHASSYLKISVANAGGAAIKRIEVHSIGDEDMAGSFGADFQNSCLVRESASGKYVTLLPREGESTLPFGEPLYIAVAPGTYASGIRVRIVDEEYHYADISSYKSFTAEAGRVYRTSMDFTPTGTVIDSEMPEIAPPAKRILFVGNSHTVDATELLPFMLNSAGVDKVELTRVYHGGYYLVGYNTNYTLADNCSIMRWMPGWMRFRGTLTTDHSLKDAVDEGPYDIVVLQEFAGSSYCWDWTKNDYAERAAVRGLIDKIRQTSPNARFYYYLSHCYGTGYSTLQTYFNNDNVAQFDTCISENAAHMMDENEGFGFEHMISTAALVQSLRTSAMNIANGFDLFRGDALHMDYGAVRYAGACLLWKTLLEDITGISYRDVPFRFSEFYPAASAYTTPVTSGNIDVIRAAVDAAYEHPMQITDLSSVAVNTNYTDEPGASMLDLTGVKAEPVTFPVDFNIGYINEQATNSLGPQPFWYSYGVWVSTSQPQAFAKWVAVSRPRQDITYTRSFSNGSTNNLSTIKVQGVWTGDYMEFVIPVRNFAAGTNINLYIPIYSVHAPIFWYFDYLDGDEWKCNHSTLTSYGTEPFERDATVVLKNGLNSVNVQMHFDNAVPEGWLRFRMRCADGSIQSESGNPVQRDEPNMSDGVYYSTVCFWSTTLTAVRFSIL